MTGLVDVGAALAAHSDGCGCVMCEAYAAGYRAGQAEAERAHEETRRLAHETAVAGWRAAVLCEEWRVSTIASHCEAQADRLSGFPAAFRASHPETYRSEAERLRSVAAELRSNATEAVP